MIFLGSVKLLLLAKTLALFVQITEPECLEHVAHSLQDGESVWVEGNLSDSYENELLVSIGLPPKGRTIEEYREAFRELGVKAEAMWRKGEVVELNGVEELRAWARPLAGTELYTEQYLIAMQKKGWWEWGDGKIRFPISKLVARLSKIASEH